MSCESEKFKNTEGKAPLELIPATAVAPIARVFKYGLSKYPTTYSWRWQVPLMKFAGAILRHTFAWIAGEEYDRESGEHHFAHVAASAMMALDQMTVDTPVEFDRPLKADPGIYEK